MKVSKNQIIDLFKLFLVEAENEYEEVKENISLNDQQFINIEFEILVDESAKKIRSNDLCLYSSYFKKKITSQKDALFLRENKIFQAIAAEWQTTTDKFDTYNALEQFCSGVAYENRRPLHYRILSNRRSV